MHTTPPVAIVLSVHMDHDSISLMNTVHFLVGIAAQYAFEGTENRVLTGIQDTISTYLQASSSHDQEISNDTIASDTSDEEQGGQFDDADETS
jgi:hypothetical protein